MANSIGKLTKQTFMMQSRELERSLPKTKRLDQRNFIHLLKQYKHVIVKPSVGSGGAGIIQIQTLDSGKYEVHYGVRKREIKGMFKVYDFVRSQAKGIQLVQQKINLARIQGKPFDLRVMVQRKKGSHWTVTGVMAKIAGSGYFITNLVRSKGKAMPLQTAWQRSNIRGITKSSIDTQIHRLATKVVHQLQHHYRINTVGIDMGIDMQGKVWIIEANFAPDKTYFLRLKDKTMYKRIMHYYRKRK